MNSPWWYRGRTWVFAAIFFAGFVIGGFVSGALHHGYVPAYRELGRYFGANGTSWVLAFAALCAAICYALRVWGSSYLRAGIVWNAGARTDTLLVAGPFRYVRNPLYLGNTFLAIGVGLLAPVAGFAVIVIGNVLFVLALAKHEEVMLEAAYGQDFRNYAARVPSLIPRVVPVPAQGNARPSLVQGLLAEVFTGALLVGIVLTVIDQRRGLLELVVLYFAGIVAQRMIARSQQIA